VSGSDTESEEEAVQNATTVDGPSVEASHNEGKSLIHSGPMVHTYSRRKKVSEIAVIPQDAEISQLPSEAIDEQRTLAKQYLSIENACSESDPSSAEEYHPDESDDEEDIPHVPVTRGAVKRGNAKFVLSITRTQKQVPKSVKIALADPELNLKANLINDYG